MRTLSVIAQNSADGLYYPGYINTNNPEDASVTVKFYSLKPQEVLRENFIIVGGAAPCPNLTVGDLVLVQIQYQATWAVLYVPGVVITLPAARDHYTRNYLVLTYTNIVVDRPRRFFVKIGPEKHAAILAFIKELDPSRNPLFRSEGSIGGSILFRRRRPMKGAITPVPPIPRTEILYEDRRRRITYTRKARARRLLVANLKPRYGSLRNADNRKFFLRKPPTKEKVTEHNTHTGSMPLLREVMKEESNTKSKDEPRKENDNDIPTSKSKDKLRNENDNDKPTAESNTTTRPVKTASKKASDMTLLDIEDEGNGSPTYSDDTFDSSDGEADVGIVNHVKPEESQKRDVLSPRFQKPSIANDKESKMQVSPPSSSSSSSANSRPGSPPDSSQSSKSTSPRPASRSSGTYTPNSQQKRNRRSSVGSDANTDVTCSTNRTVTKNNDVICNGEEVLVRWSDDGWYYFGVVVTEVGDDKYVLRDVTGYKETIDKRDVLSDIQREFQVLQPGDTVIGLHPNYVFSYAPARVTAVYPNTGVAVEFYDRARGRLPFIEVYKIPLAKFKKDVKYVRECEEKLCQRKMSVVARDDKTGLYLQCKVECPTNVNQTFFIRLPDMTFAKQSAVHIFTDKSRNDRLDRGIEYVLAPVDTQSAVYLPAWVTQSRPLCVRYCNGSVSRDLQASRCFYISSSYYKNAVDFYNHAQARIHPKRTETETDFRDGPSPWQQNSQQEKTREEETYSRDRESPWGRSNASSDARSASLARPLYVNTGTIRGSNRSIDHQSEVSDKWVSKELIYNPNAFRRTLVHRQTSYGVQQRR